MSIRAEDISGSDDGKASERRELARTPSFSAKICLKTSFSDTKTPECQAFALIPVFFIDPFILLKPIGKSTEKSRKAYNLRPKNRSAF